MASKKPEAMALDTLTRSKGFKRNLKILARENRDNSALLGALAVETLDRAETAEQKHAPFDDARKPVGAAMLHIRELVARYPALANKPARLYAERDQKIIPTMGKTKWSNAVGKARRFISHLSR